MEGELAFIVGIDGEAISGKQPAGQGAKGFSKGNVFFIDDFAANRLSGRQRGGETQNRPQERRSRKKHR
jgi:hypothetical protein